MKTPVRVAVVGAGMAGQAHAFGYRNASMAIDLADLDVQLGFIVDPDLALAQLTADRYGFDTATTDLDAVLAGPDVDVVSVAVPNFAHQAVLTRALESGKHVLAEKPTGRTAQESKALADLAGTSSAVTGVGFSFRRLPGLAAVAAAVGAGRLGQVHTVRAWYDADYAADPLGAWSWRYSQEQSGGGALLDIGSHAIDAVQFVAGPIVSVESALLRTVIDARPLPAHGVTGHVRSGSSESAPVDNDDIALLTVRLGSGAIGQIRLSRIASGVPNSLGVELFGTRGHARFDSLRPGELQLFETSTEEPSVNGPRTVYTGPEHPYFSDVAAMPGGGVGTGYAEAFIAEVQTFLRCVRDGTPMDTDFTTALRMMNVVSASREAARTGRRVAVEPVTAARHAIPDPRDGG